MAQILIVWELGANLGHVGRLRPVAAELAQRGHNVVLALRDTQRAGSLFPDKACIEAPAAELKPTDMIAEPSTYADTLHNAGCVRAEVLRSLVDRWRSIYAATRPKLIVFDFSPVAFLAAEGLNAKRVLLATGYTCPPDETPLPDLCPWRNNYPDRLLFTERRVLETLNAVLRGLKAAPIERVAELFTRADANLLTTFRELDHYPNRPDGEYVGAWSAIPGVAPAWPEAGERRVFAYVKRFAASRVLAALEATNSSTVAYVADSADLAEKLARRSVSVVGAPVDMDSAARECDFAVHHGGHGATAALLLAGKPMLLLPFTGEQQLVAERVTALGAGLAAPFDDPEAILAALRSLSADDGLAIAAKAFACQHRDFDPRLQIAHVVNRLEALLDRP